MARTHMTFGLLAGLVMFPVFHQAWYLFIPFAVLGSLFPDVDHENSKINKMVPVTKWVPKFFRHRGFFHSIFPALIIYLVFHYAKLDIVGIPVAIGYFSHLFSDALTKSGVNLLHPASTLRVQGFIETGGAIELIVFGAVGCLSLLMLIKRFF
ncbi:metal-dependent hydrolase [Candidatus Woesearchaeota archaeon]|nr:metal-dependent hydrolase [Candidatus Woesearchaeota archaeon]